MKAPKSLSPKPPPGLEGMEVTSGDSTYVVLSFPLSAAFRPETLSPAESAVIDLVLHGTSPKAIASIRSVSLRTVQNQLQSAYRKLGVTSRTELIALLR